MPKRSVTMVRNTQHIKANRRFGGGALQDRLEIAQANLSTEGPIRPQGALYDGMLRNPECLVSLVEVAAFFVEKGFEVPSAMQQLLRRSEAEHKPEQETKEQREDRRLRMCEEGGLTMNALALQRMPDGVGKIADTEGVSRQAFTEDVKNALKRKLDRKREGTRGR